METEETNIPTELPANSQANAIQVINDTIQKFMVKSEELSARQLRRVLQALAVHPLNQLTF